jgi:hypothetical protein
MPQQVTQFVPNPALKEHFNPIAALVPEKETKDRMNQDNAAVRAAMTSALGNFGGYHTDRMGQRWEIRTLAGGHQILAHPDPKDPMSFVTYDPSDQSTGSVRMGGPTYGPAIDQLRGEVSNSTIDPLTREKWDKDPLNMSYGELREAKRHLDLAANSSNASTDQVNSIEGKYQLAGTLSDLQNSYKAIGGRENFNKFHNLAQGFSSDTDFNEWARQNQDDPQKMAYLRMMRDIKTLVSQGVDISKLGGGQGSEASNIIGSALNGIGIKSPLLSLAGATTTGIIKAIDQVPGADALKANIDSARGHLLYDVYNEANTLSGPGSKTLLLQPQRNKGTLAANELEKLGVGPNDSIDEKLGIMPEPTKEETAKAQEKTPQLKGAEKEQTDDSTVSLADYPIGISWGEPGQQGINLSLGKKPTQQPPQSQAAATNQQNPPAAAVTPTPTPPPTSGQDTSPMVRSVGASQTLPGLVNVPAMAQGGIVNAPTLALLGENGPEQVTPLRPAPIGPQQQSPAMQIANNIPTLSAQEHVDGLQPGQPFKWNDGLTYVKV